MYRFAFANKNGVATHYESAKELCPHANTWSFQCAICLRTENRTLKFFLQIAD